MLCLIKIPNICIAERFLDHYPYMWAMLSDRSAPISSLHFSSFFTLLRFLSGRPSCCLGNSNICFMSPPLILFVDEEWNTTTISRAHFTFYLLTTFPFITRPALTGNQWEHDGTVNLSPRSFSLTYSSNSKAILVIWLKPSKESRDPWLTSSLTYVHQTCWFLYFSTTLTVQDLIWMLHNLSKIDLTNLFYNICFNCIIFHRR